jgi:hypothetical protein
MLEKLATKVSIVLAVILLIAGLYARVQFLKNNLETASIKLERAEEALAKAQQFAEALNENNVLVFEYEMTHAVTQAKLSKTIEDMKRALRNVKTQDVSQECEEVVADFYAPFAATLEFLREQEAVRASRIATAKANMPSRPGSTEFRKSEDTNPGGSSEDSRVLLGSVPRSSMPW